MLKTGEFDLNFLGATIICDTLEKKNAILEYLNGGKSDFDIDITSGNLKETIAKVIFNTTYIHEARHLHDYLTSPLLVSILLQRVMMLTFSAFMIEAWKHDGKRYQYLPLPLNKWISLPSDVKTELLRMKGISEDSVPMYNIASESEFSSFDMDSVPLFDQYLILCSSSSRKFDEEGLKSCLDSYNTDYSIRSFVESIAYIIQATEMDMKFGDKGIQVFEYIRNESFNNFMSLGERKRSGSEISKSDYLGYTNYTSMFTYVYRFASRNHINPHVLYPFIAYTLFWGLCGNPSTNTVKGISPRNRLESFFHLDELGYDMNLGNEDILNSLFRFPLQTFNDWDNTVHKAYAEYPIEIRIVQNGEFFPLSTISKAVDFKQFYIDVIHTGKQMSLDLKRFGCDSLSNYIYNIFKAVTFMANVLLNSATTYLYPENYIKNMYGFVNVPIRFKFANGLSISPDEIRNCPDIIIQNGVIYKDFMANCTKSEDNHILRSKDYLEAKKFIDFFDVLNGSCIVDKPGSLIKEMLPGIKPWFINI